MQIGSLPARWRKLLLSVHVATTVSVLGMDLALLALGIAGLNGSDPETIYPAARLIGVWLIAPLALLSLVTGVLLATLSSWGLFKYWWVTIKLAVTTALSGVVLFVLVPGLGDMANAVTGPAPEGLTSAEKAPLVAAPALASTFLVLLVLLAVFKPGWRLRSRDDEPAYSSPHPVPAQEGRVPEPNHARSLES